jgi:hypothetical protein
MGEAAAFYAATYAWHVAPLHSPRGTGCSCGQPGCGKQAGKHPRTKNGLDNATTDLDQIAEWWRRWPDANLLIATGAVSGFVVVDIDPARGGEDNFAELESAHGAVPRTVMSRTGGAGRHLLFAVPDGGLSNSNNKIAEGIDVRGDGGYIVAPPSAHLSGGSYAWDALCRPGEVEIAEMPAWLLDLARRKPAPPSLRLVAPSSHSLTDRIKRATSYLSKMAGAISGAGGHDATWRAALALVRGFDLPANVAFDILAREYNPKCRPQWSERELRHKIENADSDASLTPGYLLDDPKREWRAPPTPKAPRPEPSPEDDGRDAADDDDDEAADPQAWQAELSRSRKTGDIKNTYGNAALILRHTYGQRLTYNAMRLTPCLDGKPLGDADIGRIREDMERTWGVSPSKDNTAEAVAQVSVERSFHPVRDYLTGLQWDGVPRLDRVALEILGTEANALTVRMLRCWFISAVARALQPGCKVDTALVLVGRQGFFKSTFFEILGGPFFSDTAMDISGKDGLLQLAFAWLYEWPELENVTSKKQASEVKAFTTSRTDTFRPPFARAVIQHPRSTVIVGTTNEEQFLNDATGSRRFWVVRVSREVNRTLLTEWRDQLWAEARAAFASGEPWWLGREEDDAREDDADVHQVDDAVHAVVAQWVGGQEAERIILGRRGDMSLGYLSTHGFLTTGDILERAFKLEPGRWERAVQTRVGVAMRRLGWSKNRVTIHGIRTWLYYQPARSQ